MKQSKLSKMKKQEAMELPEDEAKESVAQQKKEKKMGVEEHSQPPKKMGAMKLANALAMAVEGQVRKSQK